MARKLRVRGIRGGRWIFLGRDHRLSLKWEAALGDGFERIKYGQQLQELASEWRAPFLEWEATQGIENNSLEWWSSRISERNTMLDSLFHDICYYQIGLTHMLGNVPPTLVVCDRHSVLRTLAQNQKIRRPIMHLGVRDDALRGITWTGRIALKWARYFYLGVTSLLDARRTRRGRPVLPLVGDGPVAMIRTCIDDSYFGADGVPNDRYFPGLSQELTVLGYRVLTIPWLFQLDRSRQVAFEWLRGSRHKHVIPEDFLSVTDHLWAALIVLRQTRLPRGRQMFQGIDVTPLVRAASLRQLESADAAMYVRDYRLVHRLARRGLRVDLFVDTFENMIVEKPMILAMRRWMPETTTVGFQHYISVPPLLLCLSTTEAEAAVAPHPDVIVCNSRLTYRQLVASGFPVKKLRIGPSLRYKHLLSPRVQQHQARDGVLVILSLDPITASEIILKLLEAFPVDEGIRFHIKRHPMMSTDRLRSLLDFPLPAHLTVVDGDIGPMLARASCAVIAGSSAALEVVLAGVPVVQVGRESDFDINPLKWFEQLAPPSRSPEELRVQVLKALSLTRAGRDRLLQLARELRDECVSPVTQDTFRAFVP